MNSPALPLPQLIYLFDPLCGWCYGFAPVVTLLNEQFAGRLTVEVLCGGMVLEERVQPISKAAGYIRSASQAVTQATGALFGPDFYRLAEEGTYLQDSDPPSRAVVVVRQRIPWQALAFAHSVQKAHFRDGWRLDEPGTYDQLSGPLGFAPGELWALMETELAHSQAAQDYAQAEAWAISGFPTLVYKDAKRFGILARGAVSYQQVQQPLSQLLQEAEAGSFQPH